MTKKSLIIGLAILIIFFILFFIRDLYKRKDRQVIHLTEKSKTGGTVIKSKLITPHKLNVKLKGSFNDTIIFDGIKYAPPNINLTFPNSDWYADSVWYNYDSYKATKVKLKAIYTFY